MTIRQLIPVLCVGGTLALTLAGCGTILPARSSTDDSRQAERYLCEAGQNGEAWDCLENPTSDAIQQRVALISDRGGVEQAPSITERAARVAEQAERVADQASAVADRISAAIDQPLTDDADALDQTGLDSDLMAEADRLLEGDGDIADTTPSIDEILAETDEPPLHESISVGATIRISDLPSNYFAVQLGAFASQARADSFVAANDSLLRNPITLTTESRGRVFTVVLAGIYANKELAEIAAESIRTSMPSATDPWIRSVGSIQMALKN